jgi:hypothetical protein
MEVDQLKVLPHQRTDLQYQQMDLQYQQKDLQYRQMQEDQPEACHLDQTRRKRDLQQRV